MPASQPVVSILDELRIGLSGVAGFGRKRNGRVGEGPPEKRTASYRPNSATESAVGVPPEADVRQPSGNFSLVRHPIMLDHMRRSLWRRDSGGIRLA